MPTPAAGTRLFSHPNPAFSWMMNGSNDVAHTKDESVGAMLLTIITSSTTAVSSAFQ